MAPPTDQEFADVAPAAEWDVTAYVRAERDAGRTTVSFMVAGVTANSAYPLFASKESSTDRPALLVSGESLNAPEEAVLPAR